MAKTKVKDDNNLEDKPSKTTKPRSAKSKALEDSDVLNTKGKKRNNANLPVEEKKKIGRPKGTTGTPRPDLEAKCYNLQPGDNTRIINHNLELARLPPIDLDNPEQVGNRVIEYFEICSKNDFKPHVPGLAIALGTDKTFLWDIRDGKTVKSIESTQIIKKAVNILDGEMNDLMQTGKINPVSGIFLMKNHFAYRNESEVVVKQQTPLGEVQDTKALEERYGGDIILDSSAVSEHKDD